MLIIFTTYVVAIIIKLQQVHGHDPNLDEPRKLI